jgi:hypothetical protein
MSTNHDTFVKTTLIDNSIVQPTPEPTPVGFTYLQPFFSAKGEDNIIKRFSGIGTFSLEYGDDIDNVKKYGHGGLVASEVFSGGGVVDACRLMPADAKAAGSVIGIGIGSFAAGANGKKYVRIVTKPVGTSQLSTLAPYMIDPAGTVITTAPVEDPEDPPTAPLYYTVYPLLVAQATGKGTFGNNYGVSITLDSSRDGKQSDGRRYVIRFYDGSVVLGDSFDFISASFNADAVVIPNSEIPDSYDYVYDKFAKTFYLPVKSYYSSENYELILEALKDFADLTNPDTEKYLIDFIYGVALKNQDYANIVFESASILEAGLIKFQGGTDGDLFSETIVTVNGVQRKRKDVVREELLIAFYSGQIDKNIFDHRIIDAGVTLDAWWSQAVKETMVGVFGEEVRDDIFIYVDLGEGVETLSQAMSAAEGIVSAISHPTGSVGIVIHNGLTRNRIKNIRTTGCYEIASGLPSLYRGTGPFTVYAGYQSGRVRNMKFDFYPKVVKNEIEIKPIRESNLIFAMKLDRSEDFFFMSDDSQYKDEYSVLGSCRNLIYAGEVIRTVRKVLVKYSFHPENAAGAIAGATNELNTLFAGRWFPTNLPIIFSIFQTRNDKLNKNASVKIDITFPDVIETWSVTITANRQPLV